MMTFCYLRNVHDLGPDGKTAYEKRYGVPFAGPIIPCGAGIQYKPSRPKEIDEVKWGKTKPGLFVGYVDVLDANALLHSEVRCHRVSSNAIQIDKDSNGDFEFPARTDEWQQPVDSKSFTRGFVKRCLKQMEGIIPLSKWLKKTQSQSANKDEQSDSYQKK